MLWRDARLVRPMLVHGARLTIDTSTPHEWDPRRGAITVHDVRSSSDQYRKDPP